MPKTLNLPSQLLEKIEGSDFDKQWRVNHNFSARRKARKESRKEQREAKKHTKNHKNRINNSAVKNDVPQKKPTRSLSELNDQDEPRQPMPRKSNNKPKKKLKSDKYASPILSVHQEELIKKEDEDIKYFAKKLGLKSTDLNDENDGWDDLLNYEKLDEPNDNVAQSYHSDINDGSDSFDEMCEDFERIDEEETPKFPTSTTEVEEKDEEEILSAFEDDSLGESDFLTEDEETSEEEAMTAEETMAKLATLKEAKDKKKVKNQPSIDEDNKYEIEEPKESQNEYSSNDSDSDDANPYVPPTRRESVPSRQVTSIQISERLLKTQRKFLSSLNKLTESNLNHVAHEIQLEFANNPRAEASEILTDQIMNLVNAPQLLQHSIYTTYAGLVLALYQSQGIEFPALLCQKLIPAILESASGTSNESTNMLTLLVEMYCLHIVGSRLMYDLLKKWLEDLAQSETTVELILLMIRNSGSQLRSDDPVALREVILIVQRMNQKISVSTRTRFLIDSIIALKNNRQKPVSELVIALRHRIRKSLLTNFQVAKQPLQVSLNDILQSETRGKWWLVGASWNGHSNTDGSNHYGEDDLELNYSDEELGSATSDLLEMAKKQRLNTHVRRAIFVALMGAEDYLDACIRIDKLGLKNKQEHDIPHVILHCLIQENIYNPFYALVASKQCVKHSLMKTFQFRLWDWLNSGESSSAQVAMNFARFYASLVVQKILTFNILKMADFLGSNHRIFLEVFLVSVYKEVAKEAEGVAKAKGWPVVENKKETPRDGKELTQMLTKIQDPKVLRGLTLYSSRLTGSEVTRSKKESARVKWATDLVDSVIAELVQGTR